MTDATAPIRQTMPLCKTLGITPDEFGAELVVAKVTQTQAVLPPRG